MIIYLKRYVDELINKLIYQIIHDKFGFIDNIDELIIDFIDSSKQNIIKSILMNNNLNAMIDYFKKQIKETLHDPEKWVEKNVFGCSCQCESIAAIKKMLSLLQ